MKNKFNTESYEPEKSKTWEEHNRCHYTYQDKPCYMIGTSSSQGGSGGHYYCGYHVEVMHEESKARFQSLKDNDKPKFNKEHFIEWYKSHLSQSITPDQFTGFNNDKHSNPNIAPPYSKAKESEIWNKVNCGRGSW
jgi:hypothetical protein